MRRFAVASLTAASLVAAVHARQQPPQPPPTFSAGADAVEVDVIVHDKNGRFVADLTRDEFEIREDGNPQRIEAFSRVDSTAPTTASATAPAAAPHEGSDFGRSRGPKRVFVAFFDDEHLTAAGFKRVQAAARVLFEKQFQDGDAGGVVHNGVMVNNRFTSSREELLKAIDSAKAGAASTARTFEERSWPRLSDVEAVRIVVHSDRTVLEEAVRRAERDEGCHEDPRLCGQIDIPGLVRQKAAMLSQNALAATTATTRSLIALMNGLSRIEGRKTVLLMSEGFLADGAWPIVEQAVAFAARANARIYTLDARGLDRAGMGDHLTGGDPGETVLADLLKQMDMAADSVNTLAVDTGGFVVRNQSLFDAAVAQIVADTSHYYLLGYRPQKPFDGQFRRIVVRVNRPGVVVRARRGYVATPRAPSGTTTEGAAPALPAAPLAPLPATAPAAATERDTAPTMPGESSAATVRPRPNVERNVTSLGPSSRDPDAESGWEAYKRGDVETARRSLALAAARPTPAPWVHYALGQAEYAIREFAGAVSAWEQVRAAAPEFEPVYFDLVDGYLQQRDYDKATRILRDAQSRWPRDTEVLNALGVVQVARGVFDDAVESFERAVRLAPGEAVGYFNLAKAAELRYWKNRRYVSQTRQWIANGNDRNLAIENYKKYLEMGGPFENAARDGLLRLDWAK